MLNSATLRRREQLSRCSPRHLWDKCVCPLPVKDELSPTVKKCQKRYREQWWNLLRRHTKDCLHSFTGRDPLGVMGHVRAIKAIWATEERISGRNPPASNPCDIPFARPFSIQISGH